MRGPSHRRARSSVLLLSALDPPIASFIRLLPPRPPASCVSSSDYTHTPHTHSIVFYSYARAKTKTKTDGDLAPVLFFLISVIFFD